MGSILTNGVFLPAEGERNCYEGLAANWTALDGMIGGYNVHISNTTIHVTAEDKRAWNGKADASALTAHTGDTTIHVTAEDKQAWDGHVADSVKHVTAADKAKWDAVTSKADDSDVVHKSGGETVGGIKTFTNSIQLKSNVAEYGVTGGNIQFYLMDKNNVGLSKINQGVYNNGISYITLQLYGKDSNNQAVSNSIIYQYHANFNYSYLLPTDNSVSLGKDSNRWGKIYGIQYYYGNDNVEFSTKFVTTDTNQTISGNKTFSSINGVEPSSLSLPSGNVNDVIDISSYLVNLDGTANTYTAPANGWISIAVIGSFIAIVSSRWSDSRLRESSGNVRMLYPVLKNETVSISIAGTTLAYARFIPCQGNV